MNVGELVAYIRVDDTQFQSGLSRSHTALRNLGNLAQTAGQVVATTLTAGAATAGGLLTSLVRTGAAYNGLQQNSRAALATMLGGAEKANAQMDKLDAWARNSPFAKDVFIQAQQQMIGFGVAVDDVIPALDAVQNAVASMGGGSAEIERATYALAQMQSTGRLSGETLRYLGVMGIDAATIVGKQMGKTGDEIREMASRPGGIPVTEVWDPLVTGLTEQFGGATDRIKQQWSGAVDRIRASWRDIGSHLAAPFIDPNGGGQAVTWANLVADSMRSVEKHVINAMPIIESALGGTFSRVTEVLRNANVAIASFNLDGAIRQIKALTAYTPLISSAGTALVMLGLKPIPVLGRLALGMWPLIGAIAALVASDPQLRGLGDAFKTGLGDASGSIQPLVVAVADLAMELLSRLTPGILAGAEAAGKLAGIGLDVAAMLVDVLGAAMPLVSVVSKLVEAFAALPAPILLGVTAFAAMKAMGMAGVLTKIGSSASNMGAMFMSGASTIKTYAWAATQGMDGMKVAGAGMAAAVGKAGTALKAAFMSSAPLLAITALVAAIGAFANAKAEAKARIDEYKNSLDEATGATTENTKQLVANRMEQLGMHDMLDRLGVSYSDYAEAAIGNTEAQERLNERMAEGAKAVELMNEAYLTNDYSKITPEIEAMAGAYTELNGVQKIFTDDIAEAQELHKRNAETMGITASSADSYAESLRDAANAADRLRQAERDLAAAKGDLVAAQYATKDAQDEVNAAVEEHGTLSRDQAGNIDTTTESYRAMDEAMLSQQRAMTSELEAMQKAGASQADLDARRQEFLGTQREAIEAWGHEGEEIDAYQDRLGGIPEVVSTKVEASTIEAQDDLNALLKQIQDSTGTMIIDGNQDPAVASLMESLGLVSNSEGVFSLDANNNPAIASLLLTLFDVDTSTGVMTIDGQNKEAIQKLRKTEAEINRSDGTVTILGRNRTQPVLTEVKRNINSASGHVKVYATDKTYTTVSNIIAGINGRSAYISVRTVSASGQGMGRTLAGADGLLVDYYAQGGVENHVAQIAPAGAWRIWAEEETGGEAYIPLAPAKRARSLAILDEVARRFDRVTIPRSANSFADGGFTGRQTSIAQPAAAGVVNNFYDYSTTYNPVAEPKSIERSRKAQRIGAGTEAFV